MCAILNQSVGSQHLRSGEHQGKDVEYFYHLATNAVRQLHHGWYREGAATTAARSNTTASTTTGRQTKAGHRYVFRRFAILVCGPAMSVLMKSTWLQYNICFLHVVIWYLYAYPSIGVIQIFTKCE